MSGMPLGLIVEGAVAVLLIVTIVYCIVLNDRLKKLHADRDALRQMVGDLVNATEMANNAISSLREAATEADETLNSRLQEADRFAVELANHVNAGKQIMDRLARISETVKRSDRQAPVATPAPEQLDPSDRLDAGAAEQVSGTRAKGAHAALDRLAAHKRNRENAA